MQLLPCPFCGSEIKHVESWAKSFNPPRLWHEWHHVDENPECPVRRNIGKIVCNATDDPEAQERMIQRWNTRAPAQCALPFQKRVLNWLMACFSQEVCRDGVERNHRFLEEGLELAQALECTRSEAHQLVDYVFDRPVGDPMQELGGVMVTLSALASCHDMDMNEAGEIELARVWTKIEKIRAKQLAKPKHSPLPEAPAVTSTPGQAIEKTEARASSYCALCDLEHQLHEDAQGFHHVIKGERVPCCSTPSTERCDGADDLEHLDGMLDDRERG